MIRSTTPASVRCPECGAALAPKSECSKCGAKVAPGANSGIMYRVTEADSNSYETGPEYQVLDDEGHRDGGPP